MIPYHDENDTVRTAVVTLAIIAICVLMWLIVQGAGAEYSLAESVCNLGLIPGELTQTLRAGMEFPIGRRLACVIDPGPQYLNVLTSMFLHGGWMHLIGNMWFLWLFGNNVEDSMTRPRFVVFYLLCGLGAALAQVMAEPTRPSRWSARRAPSAASWAPISCCIPRVARLHVRAARLHLHHHRAAGLGDAALLDGAPGLRRPGSDRAPKKAAASRSGRTSAASSRASRSSSSSRSAITCWPTPPTTIEPQRVGWDYRTERAWNYGRKGTIRSSKNGTKT